MALYVDLIIGEKLSIDGGRILLKVEKKTGRKVRLSIEADRSINITRVNKSQIEEEKQNELKKPTAHRIM